MKHVAGFGIEERKKTELNRGWEGHFLGIRSGELGEEARLEGREGAELCSSFFSSYSFPHLCSSMDLTNPLLFGVLSFHMGN